MHGFVSYRPVRSDQFGLSSVATWRPSRVRPRSIPSDRAVCVLGRYQATELFACLVAICVRAWSLRSDRAWLVRGPMAIPEIVRGRFGYVSVAFGQSVFSGSIEIGTRIYRKALCKDSFYEDEHPLSVLGDMIVRIAGTVIRLYVGKGEFPGHLDQGDLIREKSVGVEVGVSSHRRLLLYDSLGCFLVGFRLRFVVFYVVDPSTLRLLARCCVSLRRRRREIRVLRFEFAELLGPLLQLLGMLVELLLQAMDFKGELGILHNLFSSSVQLGYLTL
ncbi:hypothetical protein F2Q69_00021604 [Brassica cretica]|uniref:Uncharacterized protein n=1 Tax=Brassica cretica TaxID=69181 RepID=A0A8S9QPC1_BRACR|nr:hypothetical protein F2Q69_00021604 [Brassica cretica]